MSLASNYLTFFHILVICHFIFVIHYDFKRIAPLEYDSSKFDMSMKFIHLKIWNLFIQLTYFTLAFITDVVNEKFTFFKKFKDYIFASLAFPIAFDVGAMYWLLYIINRDLVTPHEIQDFIPAWFTHMMRTSVLIFIIIEMYWTPRKYPKHCDALISLVAVLLAYIIWMCGMYFRTGIWGYPIMEIFTWVQRVGFFGFNILVPITFYFIGDLMNKWFWSGRVDCEMKNAKILHENTRTPRKAKISSV